ERRAVAYDFREEGVRDARGGAAVLVSGEVAVEIAPVGEIAHAAIEALDVDDRHTDDRAIELVHLDFVQHAAYDLDPVQLVSVNCRGQAEHRAGARAVEHDHGRGRCEAFDGGAAAPGQAPGRARRDLTTEKPQLRFWLQPCGVSRQIGLSMRACEREQGGSDEKPSERAVPTAAM